MISTASPASPRWKRSRLRPSLSSVLKKCGVTVASGTPASVYSGISRRMALSPRRTVGDDGVGVVGVRVDLRSPRRVLRGPAVHVAEAAVLDADVVEAGHQILEHRRGHPAARDSGV